MLRSKQIERICCIVMALSVLLTCGVMAAVENGMIEVSHVIGYENRLFDQSRVHTIDIVMDDWAGFIDTCENEAYATCNMVIDGESYRNVAIRAKGNTSLSSVAQYGNGRYSFKVEFDHYDSSITYHGLDKLSLNNVIQDATYMKDYLAYTLMGKMGVAAPLCSYVQINVNGQPWGFYLAVEGVEDSFLARNYGSNTGELYKPDSMSFGGGRGNGRGFDMDDFDFGDSSGKSSRKSRGGGGGFGMGSNDVKLQYVDDDPASYSNIFNNAKTDVTDADKDRLIATLKKLSEGDTSVVDTDQVMRYMAVHHFLCNDDSYTGMMVHNYYLRESDGVLSMIPWDYNLAFGAFSGGMGGATSTVNSPIDTPVSMGDASDRPLIGWIWDSEEATAAYHAVYQEFMDTVFNGGWFAEELERVIAMIDPYVRQDTNGFFTYEEFQTATATLRTFCEKRVRSLNGQLAGTIPSTSAGQRRSDALIDASEINLSDMGSMDMGGGFGGRGGGMPSMPGDFEMQEGMTPPEGFTMPEGMDMSGGFTPPDFGDSSGASSASASPPVEAATPTPVPEAGAPDFGDSSGAPSGLPPEGFTMPEGMDMPGEFTPPGFSGSTTQEVNGWPYMIASLLALAIGLMIAKRWKSNL